MTEDSEPAAPLKAGANKMKSWLMKPALAVLTAFGMAFIAYFTGLIPKFLDPYFGDIPKHEIAIAVTRDADGLGIDGGQASISEFGVTGDDSDKATLDSKPLKDGDARLLAETASKNGRLDIRYETNGTIYRYRQTLDYRDLSIVSLKFPSDFYYEGKDKPSEQVDTRLMQPGESITGLSGSNAAVDNKKESLDNAFGEAALSLDDITAQMRKAREAREAATPSE